MFPTGSTIAIGSDHAGYALKEQLKQCLADMGYVVDDKGTHNTDSCDYPDFGAAVAHAVADHKAIAGVLVCSTGIGISISANKVPGIRAALVHHIFEAEMTRRHNDANIICFGAATTGPVIAIEALKRFMETDFDGGRHERRVRKILDIERGLL
ncbi:MAG: ribose 5-phosphate isomerase B [Proteobacteria bacterium]|jgi:ribose 5-phosphate isomerase B|nr:ribose 5-phosphate isomerase B [Pseudomonadota bacterium]